MTDITSAPAIDVHAHYGPYLRDDGGIQNEWMSADPTEIIRRARSANTRVTVVSPLIGLMPRGQADVESANVEAARVVQEHDELCQWVIVHPLLPPTFAQAKAMLSTPGCVGIKIHPEEHEYPIREHGESLFALAAQHDAVVLAHSGDERSLPADLVRFADAYPNVKLILAHLGNGGAASGDPTLQVRAVQSARSENIFIDTSSARSILPGLLEWAVDEVGVERILYGTDTPLYLAAMQRARIDRADLSDDQKRDILHRNAERLLDL
jgi:hypothetical protein